MYLEVVVEGKTPQEILQALARAMAEAMPERDMNGLVTAMNAVPGVTAQGGDGGGPG